MIKITLALLFCILSFGTAPALEQPLWRGEYYNDAVPVTGADKLHALGITGKGLTTAILDSGFDLGNAIFKNTTVVNGYTYSGSDGEHGTLVAGTVISMAPDSDLWLRAYSGDEDAPVAEAFRKIAEDAARYTIAALNVSWGDGFEGFYGSPADVSATHPLTEDAVRALLAAGVQVVGATGNSSVNGRMSFPDGLPGILSVGSMNPYGHAASHGTLYDKPGMFLLAPGADIHAAYADIPFEDVLPDGYRTTHGTSAAAPHVTGAITLLKSGARAASTEEIVAALYDSAARVVYDPNERIDVWRTPDYAPPDAGDVFVSYLASTGGDCTPYTDWLSSMDAKFDANTVTAGEWRLLSRIATVAYIVSQNFNTAAAVFTTPDGETLYGDALFVKIMELTDVFAPLPPTEFGFLQVDAAYRLLTSRRSMRLMQMAAATGSPHAMAFMGFSGAMGAALDQDLADLFQRFDGQPGNVLARAARQLGSGWVASTLHSSIFGHLGLHAAAERRLADFQTRVRDTWTPWAEGFGSYHTRTETRNGSGYHGSFAGLMTGMEKVRGETLTGGFAAWANHNIRGDGASRGNWGTFGIYGGLRRDEFSAALSLSAGIGDYGLSRAVDAPAASLVGMRYDALRVGAKGDSFAAALSARGTADWTLFAQSGWAITPGVEAAFAHTFMNGYTESGGGIRLSVRGHSESYAEGGAGVRVSKTFFRGGRPFLTASVKASGLYGASFGGAMRARFAAGGETFSVEPERIKTGWFVPEATLAWRATERLTVSATYRGRFGRRSSANTGSLSVGLAW